MSSVKTAGKEIGAGFKDLGNAILETSPKDCINAIQSGYKKVSSNFSTKKKSFLKRQLEKLEKAVQ